jgi:transposase-like protein
MGADTQGEKHLVALDEATSESETSWREVLHDLKARGLRAPRLAVADGANGFWSALSAEYPGVVQQRCWLHKIRNVLDKVPEKLKGEVHRKLREICNSTARAEATSNIDSRGRLDCFPMDPARAGRVPVHGDPLQRVVRDAVSNALANRKEATARRANPQLRSR